jgi:uncharacterized repeat protein (TIGR03803 family)
MNERNNLSFAARRCALSITAAAVLVACGGSQSPIGAPTQSRVATPGDSMHHKTSAKQATGIVETVIYSFRNEGEKHGNEPRAGLLNVNGTLYGTTYLGGNGGRRHRHGAGTAFSRCCGTVFSVTPSGSETDLQKFGKNGDGKYPYASDLIDVDGTLYGTTRDGGTRHGTVFAITPSGSETVYGTTSGGGAYGRGTVFSITPSGTETLVHSFGASGDGIEPEAELIAVNGTLYGTTYLGGAILYGGTVFSITPSGAEAVLHSFGGAGDGANPQADLVDINGTLYGTTVLGGAHNHGAIYSLTGF